MARKKLSEMTPIERADKILNGVSWDDAEKVGIEILARCTALHIYARSEGVDYLEKIESEICKRGDEWAHEGNHPSILAFASVGHKLQTKEIKLNINIEHGKES